MLEQLKNVKFIFTSQALAIFVRVMRGTFIFFLLLCFLLLRGYNSIYAKTHHQKKHKHLVILRIPLQAQFGNVDKNLTLIEINNTKKQKDEFINLEDEDDDFVFSPKYVLGINYYISLFCASMLIGLFGIFTNSSRFSLILPNNISNKYIAQRALRL